jgi:hypothetical protein
MQQAEGEVFDHQNRHSVPAEAEPLKPEQLNVNFLYNFLQRARSAFKSSSIIIIIIIIIIFFFFFFNSSTPSDPYSRSVAPDAIVASSTPSINNLKNKFAAKTLPKLLHFPPPLVLVLLQLLYFFRCLLFSFSCSHCRRRYCYFINSHQSATSKTDLQPHQKKKPLPKLFHFSPPLILLTLLLLLQPLCFFRYLRPD